ncbi:MAG: DUF3471 domain-containing protein [Pyrinomonadaceae bacterium]|nr:DUF3471 domain-containing protein [Pyrinomonadaceae bacterium]
MKKILALLICLCAFSPLALSATAQDGKAQEKPAQEKKEAKSYDLYAGEYQVSEGFILTITHENGKLMGQPTGDEKVEFKPEEAADQFFSSAVNARLKFVWDEKNTIVVGVIVTIGGKDYPSKRIK